MMFYAAHLVRWIYNMHIKKSEAISLGFYVLYPNGEIYDGPMSIEGAEELARWLNNAPHPPGSSHAVFAQNQYPYREAVFSAHSHTVHAQRINRIDAPWVEHGTLEYNDKGGGAFEVKVKVNAEFIRNFDPSPLSDDDDPDAGASDIPPPFGRK
jgi:hypothetical protein